MEEWNSEAPEVNKWMEKQGLSIQYVIYMDIQIPQYHTSDQKTALSTTSTVHLHARHTYEDSSALEDK